MLKSAIRASSVYLLCSFFFQACSVEDSSPPFNLTFDGTTPFSGTWEFRASDTMSSLNNPGLYSIFEDDKGSGSWTRVFISIPEAVFEGVGEYNICGRDYETAPTTSLQYCYISIEHSFGYGTATWGSMMPYPEYGPLPDCRIIVTDVSDLVHGSIDCAGFEFVSGTASSLDTYDALTETISETIISRVRGNFGFRPLMNIK
jgi:hypothetical protein